MKEYNFEIKSADERLEIWCNDMRIASLNHDEHGWEGMEVATQLTKNIARIVGARVFESEIDEEEY